MDMYGRLGKGGYAYGQPKKAFGFSLSVTRRKLGVRPSPAGGEASRGDRIMPR